MAAEVTTLPEWTDPLISQIFEGRLVRLAAARPEDRETLARWSNDVEYLRLMDDEPARPQSPDSFPAPRDDDNRDYQFRIRTLADDRLIGFVALHSFVWNCGTALLSIGIGEPSYRGQGYGTDAMQLILRYAFTELNLHRVGLNVYTYNIRAIRAYQKVGFVAEGLQRETVHRDGQRYDTLWMGILRREWLQTQESQNGTPDEIPS